MENRTILWISEQGWAPSRPTVIKAVSKGIVVRTRTGEYVTKPPIRGMLPAAQAVVRASEGAARVLSVLDSVVVGDAHRAASDASEVIPLPYTRRLTAHENAPSEPVAFDHAPPERAGATAETVLRELARVDGATAIAEEVRLTRAAKTTAGNMLAVTHGMLAVCDDLQRRVLAKVPQLQVENWMDVLMAAKIIGTVTLASDRATRVAARVLQLERELLGDPREAANASGAPGETFAMGEDEALAELRRCGHVAERYGVPFTAGATAELAATVVQHNTQPDIPSVFVSAREDADEIDEGPDAAD